MVWRNDRAQELLDEEGRTRRWLAKQCAIAEGSLKLYMSGNRKPGSSAIKLMAMSLKCSEAYLLNLSDERFGSPSATG